MSAIEAAIENFRREQLGVYKRSPIRILGDSRAAARATRDHIGRWLFELLQNCDDAKALKVQILAEGDALYVADNGEGLKSEAVRAICGTDFSDKTSGTIGRKGVGFKAVYDVTNNPHVFIVKDGGIEFNPDKTREWLQENGFDGEHVPYQWIPFFVSWEEAQKQDPVLDRFEEFKTIVVLRSVPSEQQHRVQQLLKEWPPHALLTFRHVCEIKAPGLEVSLDRGIWQMQDSRGGTRADWLVTKHMARPPEEFLGTLSVDERRAVTDDGVGFLIAAPREGECIVPTAELLPVHVFYPTEEKGPVRLLLHAEFLVKSDRTALIPISGSPFNAWVARRLACHVCEFANNAFRPESPSSHVALLVPFEDRASHPVAEVLWQCIVDEAKASLKLANFEGAQVLSVEKAKLISVTVRVDLARTILNATDAQRQLLHGSFDEDMQAREAVKELGCGEIRDLDLLKVIEENAKSHAQDEEWIWACWEWLGTWVGKEPYGDKHKERVQAVRGLSIVPIEGHLRKPSDLKGRIVTWRADNRAENLPIWLPLTFTDDWFRDRIQSTSTPEGAVNKLHEEFDIKEPGSDVVQRAVGQAIEQYWKDKSGAPRRFLDFIVDQDWHETSNASSALQRCPVLLSQPVQSEVWDEAGKAYFGREWGNGLLADLYDGIDRVAWVREDGENWPAGRRRAVLEWLGIVDCPRLIDNPSGQAREIHRVATKLPYHTAHSEISAPKTLEHIEMARLHPTQMAALVRLLAKHWTNYYSHYITVSVGYRYYGWHLQSVESAWWEEAKKKLQLSLRQSDVTAPLNCCWLPDKQTDQAIGDLISVVDLGVFVEDKVLVHNWLESAAALRTRAEQITVAEWKELLSKRIPEKVPAESLVSDGIRDRITRWYGTCLKTAAEKGDIQQNVYASLPLLCRKGDSWQYVSEATRYLNDHNEFAKAFSGDVFLFDMDLGRSSDAVKYFGVLRLSKFVRVESKAGEPYSPLPDEFQGRLDQSLPYVWTWRSSQSKDDADKLFARLKHLKVQVVPTLTAILELSGVHHEIDRRYYVDDNDVVLLQKEHANETALAQALAEAVGVKSEVHLYGSLLRCNDDGQRRDELLAMGIPEAELKSRLREYSGCDERAKESLQESRSPDKEVHPSQISPVPPTIAPPQQNLPAPRQEGPPARPPDARERTFRLKDAQTVVYENGNPLGPGQGLWGSGGGGETSVHETRALNEDEKAQLEEAGRRIASRKLEEMGYEAEEMSRENPGFDLRGKKADEELRVEVKAHTGISTVADLTQRQYKEYLGQQGYRWELWNIEHLAEQDSQPVTLTRYGDIPDVALDTRTFRVDLRKCNCGQPDRPLLQI